MKIPYGKAHLVCPVAPDATLLSRIDQLHSEKTGLQLVEEALSNPIGAPSLRELAAGKKTCTIIISDHTRPVPSRDILPPMLRQLREGNPEIRIKLLVATGFHRLTTKEELVSKLGEEIAAKEHIVVHDAFNAESNVEIGLLPSGAPLVIDRAAVLDLLNDHGEAELVLTGRNVPEEILEKADYISEIRCVRHPYETKKAPARKGIEY